MIALPQFPEARRLLACLACAACLGLMPTLAPCGTVALPPTAQSMSMLPGMDIFIDVTGAMDVEEAASPANAAAYRPLSVRDLPPMTGVSWLRFTLAPLQEGSRPRTLLLDLGPDVPDAPVLFEPRANPATMTTEWRETAPGHRHVLLLPEESAEPLTCYVRLDGLPGVWFAPLLRTPQNAAADWTSLAGGAALLAMAVVMALCLLRWLSERGQWRIWTVLYVSAAFAQGMLGMPAYGSGGLSPAQAGALLTPGLALMLLPHVGRHLLRTKGRARLLDIQFILLSLPGAVLALLPLLPGYSWIIRYLSLWPLLTALLVPSALGGAVMGLGGARRFLLGCGIPPLFTAAGLLGGGLGVASEALASAPLWGVALSALLIAGTGQPRDAASEEDAEPAAFGNDAEAPISLDQPLDDPNLRLLPSGGEASHPADNGSDTSAPRHSAGAPAAPPAEDSVDAGAGAAPASEDASAWAESLRPSLERLLRESVALGNCSLPPAVRQAAESLSAAANDLAERMNHPGRAVPAERDEAPGAFNLQHLLRAAHDTVATAAENAGIGIAWYMPPLLGHMYEGRPQALRETLDLLLESAVRATASGAVHLAVRRVPEGGDPGHLLFSVSDTGAGLPPLRRSTLAVARAWELAVANGGYCTVECGPKGTTVSFSLHLKALEPDTVQTSARPRPLLVLVGADAREMPSLSRAIDALGCRAREAQSLEDALRANKADPALMAVVWQPGTTASEADALGRFEAEALRAGLPLFKALAVTRDKSRWDDLANAGYTHALLTPLDGEAFAATLESVLREGGLCAAGAAAPDALPDLFGTGPEAAQPAGDAAVPASQGMPALQLDAPSDARLSAPPVLEMPRTAASHGSEALESLSLEPAASSTEATAPPVPQPSQTEVLTSAALRGMAWGGGESTAHQRDCPAGHITRGATPEAPLSPAASAMEQKAAPSPGPAASADAASGDAGPLSRPPSTREAAEAAPLPEPLADAAAVAAALRRTGEATLAPARGGRRSDSIADAQTSDEWVGEPMPMGSPPSSGPAPAASDEWVGEPMPLGMSRSHRSEQMVAEEWVGEPMPMGSPPSSDPAPAASDEWVGEPMPLGTSRSHRSEQMVAEEWVGEPMPLGSPPSSGGAVAAAAQSVRRETPRTGGAGTQPSGAMTADAPASLDAQMEDLPHTAAGRRIRRLLDSAGDRRAHDGLSQPAARQSAPRAQPAHAPGEARGGLLDFIAGPATGAPANTPAPPASAPSPDANPAPPSGEQPLQQLVGRLDAALDDAQQALQRRDCGGVGEAAGRIAADSEGVGFRSLARMALCVQRAAAADDLGALDTLLPDLIVAVERTRNIVQR